LAVSRLITGSNLVGCESGDLPVQTPTKFEPTVNLKTAKALAPMVPNSLLAIFDKVIE
jgi:putative ABC transport system substrate-binding protein